MDGDGIGVEELPAGGQGLLLLLAQCLEPATVVGPSVAQFGQQLLQDGAGIALDADVDVAIAAELCGVDVHLDDLGLGVEALAVGEAEVQGGADDEDDVGAAQGTATGAGEEQGVILRYGAARHGVQVDGRLEPFDELAQAIVGGRPVDEATGHDQRLLGRGQELSCLPDDVGVGLDTSLGAVAGGESDVVLLHPAKEHIGGHLQEDGAVAAAEGMAEGHSHILGDAGGVVQAAGPLGQGSQELHLVHLLEGALLEIAQGAAAADEQHGAAVLVGVGHGGDGVGDAGAGGDHRHAALAGGPRPALGGVAGRLLVTDVDHLDVLVNAGVVDGLDVAAAEGEDDVHSLLLEAAGHQIAAVDKCHWASPS